MRKLLCLFGVVFSFMLAACVPLLEDTFTPEAAPSEDGPTAEAVTEASPMTPTEPTLTPTLCAVDAGRCMSTVTITPSPNTSTAVALTQQAAGQALPDLTVHASTGSVTFDGPCISSWDELTPVYPPQVCVYNAGQGDAGPFVVEAGGVTYPFDGLAVGEQLCAAAEIIGSLIIVDADNQVAESNEDNNTTYFPTLTQPPMCTVTPTPGTLDPLFADLAGSYGCMGTEYGMLAASGTLTIFGDGTFEFDDYYPKPVISGHLEWVSETELRVVEEVGLMRITVDGTALYVTVREDSGITHTDQGVMTCSPSP